MIVESKLPDNFYQPLEKAIVDSSFWRYPNSPEDSDYNNINGEWWEQTEAAEVLGDAIQLFFDENNFPITIVVRNPDPEVNRKWIIGPEHEAYPNRIVIGGEQGLSSRGRFVMYLNMGLFDDSFNISDIDENKVARVAGSIIRHELIHALQYEKRRKKQKTTRISAKDRYEAEGEIVDSENRPRYLGSRIEIDAYAHQFAEELLSTYGKEEALNILRGQRDLSALDLSSELKEYFIDFGKRKSTTILKKKIYDNIMDLSSRGIYERKKRKKKKKNKKVRGSYPEDSYEIGNVKNLMLNRKSTHGGWPEGEYDPPVMTRIANWLKDMEMID
jgi:hypothetical protein